MKNFILSVASILLLTSTTFGKDGLYLEFKITSPSMTGNSKTYTADGDTRSETTMKSTKMTEPMVITTLILQDAPGKSYTINEKDKTYSELDAGKTKSNDDDYEVTVLGKETVNGYNSTHVSVRYKKTQHTTEMWISKDVSGYAGFTSVKNDYLGGAGFFGKMKEKGVEGFVVRMLTVGGRGEKMQLDLVKAEKRSLPASLFSLAGYTKKAVAVPGVPGMDMEKLQKMTPAERKKFMEEMRSKYQQKH